MSLAGGTLGWIGGGTMGLIVLVGAWGIWLSFVATTFRTLATSTSWSRGTGCWTGADGTTGSRAGGGGTGIWPPSVPSSTSLIVKVWSLSPAMMEFLSAQKQEIYIR